MVDIRGVGWTQSGSVFYDTGENPIWLSLHDLGMPGLSEALRMMVVGEKRRVWVPASAGYDSIAQSHGNPGGPLLLDLELVAIEPTPHPPPPPADAAAPPRGAQRTPSGVSYRFLAHGRRDAEAAKVNGVLVYNYSSWTAKGYPVTSTFPHARPKTARLSDLDPAEREVLSMMRVGDKIRYWYFEDAKGALPGALTGPMVAELELIYVYSL